MTDIFWGKTKIGVVTGKIFRKYIKDDTQVLQKGGRAFACNVSALYKAQEAGAEVIVIEYGPTGQEYCLTIKDLLDNGYLVDWGYGEQRAKKVKYWYKGTQPPKQMELF